MKCTLDSIFKVGFGVEFHCLERSSKEANVFMEAFNDSNAFVFKRYLDPFWKLKRVLNFGSEASLKKNIETIDNFVHSLIKTKRNLLSLQKDFVSSSTSIMCDLYGFYIQCLSMSICHIRTISEQHV
jgi:hypothetical protein